MQLEAADWMAGRSERILSTDLAALRRLSDYPPQPESLSGSLLALTPEELHEASEWEQGLWDQAVAHLREAAIYAAARFPASHVEDFLTRELQDILCELELKRPATGHAAKAKAPIPPALRKEIFERDAYRCQHCGTHKDLTIDHVVPEALGGPTTAENLQTLCRSCNSRKGTRLQ